MLKLKFIIFMLFLIISFSTFSYTGPTQLESLYTNEKGIIYVNIRLKEIMMDADFDTFKILEESQRYATDKDNVFYVGKKLEKLNPKETSFLGGIKNKYEHFVFADDGYIKDKNYVYYEGNLVEGADANTFELIQSNPHNAYGKDKNHLYLNNKKLDIDINTYQFIATDYLMDKSGVYYKGNQLEGVNLNDFEKVLEKRFLVSGKNVFFLDQKTNIDPNTLRFEGYMTSLGNFVRYAFEPETHLLVDIVSDKNNIYIQTGDKLVAINPEDIDTFTFLYYPFKSHHLDFYVYAKDSKNYYKIYTDRSNVTVEKISKEEIFNKIQEDKKVEEEKPTVYREIEAKALKRRLKINANGDIFFDSIHTANRDAKEFSQVLGYFKKNSLNSQFKYYYKDKNNIYLNDNKMEYDAATFKLLSGDYSSDKNGVYFKDKKINEVNPRNFQIKSISDHPNSIYNKFLISNNAVFINDKKTALDANSLEILGSKFIYLSIPNYTDYAQITIVRDKNSIYLVNDNGKINALDVSIPSSFEILSNTLDEIYAKDLLHHYRITIKEENIFYFEKLNPHSKYQY